MSRCRVVKNNLPRLIKAMPRAVDGAVDDTTRSLGDVIRATAWKRSGIAVSTTKEVTNGPRMRSRVGIGEPRGRGFYVIFQEYGAYNTWKGQRLGPDPRVAPAAHMHEPILAEQVSHAVRAVCAEAAIR